MMDLTGKVVSLSRDFHSRKPILTLEINEEDLDGIIEYGDRQLSIRLARKSEKRSLDSNAYFHVLADKLRRKLGLSMARMKNELIAKYGQIEYLDDGRQAELHSNIPVMQMLEQGAVHVWLDRVDVYNGEVLYIYRVYRGSHTYDTQEMSELIAGTVDDCKDQGIETATPEELARMAALWESRYGQQNG